MKKRILTLIPDSGDAHRQKGVDNKCLQQAFQLSEELECVVHACAPAKTRSKKSNGRFLSVGETIATDGATRVPVHRPIIHGPSFCDAVISRSIYDRSET